MAVTLRVYTNLTHPMYPPTACNATAPRLAHNGTSSHILVLSAHPTCDRGIVTALYGSTRSAVRDGHYSLPLEQRRQRLFDGGLFNPTGALPSGGLHPANTGAARFLISVEGSQRQKLNRGGPPLKTRQGVQRTGRWTDAKSGQGATHSHAPVQSILRR